MGIEVFVYPDFEFLGVNPPVIIGDIVDFQYDIPRCIHSCYGISELEVVRQCYEWIELLIEAVILNC
jgi:hypothetical protein